jgi:hypothetical protein
VLFAVNALAVRASRVVGRSWVGIRRRTHRPPRRTDVAVRVDGPPWLTQLLAPTVAVITDRRAHVTAPVIEASASDFVPFVQAMLSNPVKRRWPEGLPDAFASRARSASLHGVQPLLQPEDSDMLRQWTDATAEAHIAFRLAHRITADEVVDAQMRCAGLAVRRNDRAVTVVCVTMRPERFEAMLACFDRQVHHDKRLVVITNSSKFEENGIERCVANRSDVTVIEAPETMSLGACLNIGIDMTTTRYFAKFDDDDEYGPHYLHDLLAAHRFAGAGVVGKHCYHAYIADRDLALLRFPGREYSYTPYLAGGTLVIDLERTNGIRFPEVSIGEDQGFIAACHRHGIPTFGADRFNFVQMRHDRNTWNPPIKQYLGSCVPLGHGLRTELVDV